MAGNARDPYDAADSRAVPHPVLKKYYARESDRRPFVNALFDNAAEHYDFVCGLARSARGDATGAGSCSSPGFASA